MIALFLFDICQMSQKRQLSLHCGQEPSPSWYVWFMPVMHLLLNQKGSRWNYLFVFKNDQKWDYLCRYTITGHCCSTFHTSISTQAETFGTILICHYTPQELQAFQTILNSVSQWAHLFTASFQIISDWKSSIFSGPFLKILHGLNAWRLEIFTQLLFQVNKRDQTIVTTLHKLVQTSSNQLI